MAETVALELERVSLRYGQRWAVERLTLRVDRGEVYGLLGPNGSGKSTTLGAIAGLLEPAEGAIRVAGVRRRDRPADYARKLGYVPQEPSVYEELSARANLAFFASLYDLPRERKRLAIDRCLDQVGLSGRADDRVGDFSGGMKQRLNIAAALVHDPELLLLDEPTVALDPASREILFELIASLKDLGRAIVLTTHQLEEAEHLCDQVGVLHEGALVRQGPPAEALHHGQPTGVQGMLRREMSEEQEIALRTRLGDRASLRVHGRQFRLIADDAEHLGLALAFLAAEGVELDGFRTLAARLEPSAEFTQGATACSVR
jgi:ABC-2 type transport system ATP-binding protein